MHIVRAAGLSDLDYIMELARLSGRGFTSLPEDEGILSERLSISEKSFSGELDTSSTWYTLVLEHMGTGRIDGIAAVRGEVGHKRPHYSFRIITLAQCSYAVGTRFDHQALMLVNECRGWSEVGSLFVRKEARSGGVGSLLAASRYMLVASAPTLFSDTIMAELRGYFGRDGSCPFWDHVSSKFFRMPFDEADAMITATNGQFILDLAPRHPIYLELIPHLVREKVGAVHPDGEAALAMLEKEGFRRSGLIDIFDGGPTVACDRDRIDSIRRCYDAELQVADKVEGPRVLLSTGVIENFRCMLASALIESGGILVTQSTASALGAESGAIVKVRA